MKKFRLILLVLVFFGGVTVFTSCDEETCDRCEVQDVDNQLDATGEDCDEDFVNECQEQARLFPSVTCTCDA